MSWVDMSWLGGVGVSPHPSDQLALVPVSNDDLRGSTKETAAQIIQWVSFADSDIVPPASTWVFPTLGIMHYNKQVSGGGGRAGSSCSPPVNGHRTRPAPCCPCVHIGELGVLEASTPDTAVQ